MADKAKAKRKYVRKEKPAETVKKYKVIPEGSSLAEQLEHLQLGLDKALADNAALRQEIDTLRNPPQYFEYDPRKVWVEASPEIPDTSIPATEEAIIPGKFGGATGIAIRTAETPDSFRALVTIRFGFSPEKIAFNFGNYGGSSGPTIQGGGDGNDPPPPGCP